MDQQLKEMGGADARVSRVEGRRGPRSDGVSRRGRRDGGWQDGGRSQSRQGWRDGKKSPHRGKSCFHSGGPYPHRNESCPAIGQECLYCHIVGHFERVCRGKQRDMKHKPVWQVSERVDSESDNSEDDIYIPYVTIAAGVNTKLPI